MRRGHSVWLAVGRWFSDQPGVLVLTGVTGLFSAFVRYGKPPRTGGPWWLVGLLGVVALACGVSGYWYRRHTRRRDERRQAGCCLDCGYDLRGNVSDVCPECGKRAEGGA